MVKKEEIKQKGEELPMTESQRLLIKDLCFETGFKLAYEEGTFLSISRKTASKHIDDLKALKASQNGNANANAKINGFDKIQYSMIYKLVWREWKELSSYALANQKTLNEIVFEEYKKFKDAQEYAKQEIAKEAGQ